MSFVKTVWETRVTSQGCLLSYFDVTNLFTQAPIVDGPSD